MVARDNKGGKRTRPALAKSFAGRPPETRLEVSACVACDEHHFASGLETLSCDAHKELAPAQS